MLAPIPHAAVPPLYGSVLSGGGEEVIDQVYFDWQADEAYNATAPELGLVNDDWFEEACLTSRIVAANCPGAMFNPPRPGRTWASVGAP